jgi:hypothetical protein
MTRLLLLLLPALAVSADAVLQALSPVPPPAPFHLHTDLAAARREAAATGKPLLVLSVLGDCHKHC